MVYKSIIGQRLKEFGHKKFKTLAELARQMGISPQTLTTYTEGVSVPGGRILYKLRELGCDINWLLSDDDELQKLVFRKVEDVGLIPKFEYNISNLVPKLENGEIHEEWYYKEVVNFDPNTHVFLKVDESNGSAMVPLVQPGDMVLLDITAELNDGDMVAARWDDNNGQIRILNINDDDPNKIVLVSFNQLTKAIFCDKDKVSLYKVVMVKKGK